MRFWGDDRAQSVQIGAIILFGFLIIAMATYQTQAVPASNSAVEFEHAQAVEQQFIDLRSAVLSTARTGNPESTSLTLGTRYPQRTFFVNPPPATGSVSTSDPQTLRIDNATVDADGNVGEFWDNQNLTFDTRSIRYAPRYNEYDDPPDLVYEHSLVAAEFDQTVLTRTGQTTVDNGEISLTLVEGNLSQSGVSQRGIDPEVLSQNARRVTLDAESGENITLVLPTTTEGDERRADLADEWESEIEADANVTTTTEGIRVEVDQHELELRLAMVGLGRDTPQINESGGYITEVSRTDGEVVAEVRDRFNNPVEGAVVRGYDDEEATDPVGNYTTNADGRVSVPTESVRALTIDSGDEEWKEIIVEQEVRTDPNDPVEGPSITNESGDSTTVEQGDPYYPAVSVSSVGTVSRPRSGTPIQEITYSLIGPDGETIVNGTYAEFDPDTSNRSLNSAQILSTATEVTPIETSDLDLGNYTVDMKAQDASGRVTPVGEEAEVDFEVVEPTDEPSDRPPAEEMYDIRQEDWAGDREYIFEITSDNVWEVEWDFGDGTTSTNHYVQHTYDQPGTYDITLDVVYQGTEYTYTDTVEVQQTLEPVEIRDTGDPFVFRVANTADEQVTVEQFAVDATSIGGGYDFREFDILRTDVQDGSARLTGQNRFASDGTVYDMEEGSQNQGQYATIGANVNDVDIDLRDFAQELPALEYADSPENADVTVTLVLSDGSEQTFYFAEA